MRFVVLGVALVCACWASPPRPAAPPRDTNIALAVEQVEMPNGLKLVVVPEPTAHEVSLTVRYAVGSVDDPRGREGLAHLVEHLMFEHVRDGEALFDFLERSAFGFSGFTTLDSTVYNEHAAPAMTKELLALEHARLAGACEDIPESAFVRQREIVRNELREREDADRIVHALHEGVFAHGLGHATPQTVGAITRQDACAFIQAHYAPNNAVVVMSGPITLRDAQVLVEQTLGTVRRGDIAPRRALAAASRRNTTFDAPTDRPWFVLAWPMPATTVERARMRAVASMAVGFVNARVNGVVTLTELGAGAARAIAIAVAPSSDISFSDAIASTKSAISGMSPWFGSGIYEHAKNRALYALATSLDHTLDRDMRFADDVARGLEVRPTEQVRGLMSMSREDARDLVQAALRPDKATLVSLRPSTRAAPGGTGLTPTFRELRRRRAEDPDEAARPASVAATNPFRRARSRMLENGMTVVLLPLSALPTVEMRLVLPTGTGDESAGERGIATIAAHSIEAAFDADMLRFVQSGGSVDAEVGLDDTTFSVRGLAGNLDILLSGLAATVREGSYTVENVRDAMTSQRLVANTNRNDRSALERWREALYGVDHPYRHAGQMNRGNFELTTLEQFRSQHYRPRGATLIIAGRFDPEIADRWVDHYFSDWAGAPAGRRDRPASLRPLAFAQTLSSAQTSVQIAFTAPTSDEVELRVVVEMIEGAIADVREQIAASYGLQAFAVHRRAITTIEVSGFVDPARAGEALALLRERLGRLRERSDETASRFVSARRRVLARLGSVDTTAGALANLTIDDVSTWTSSMQRTAALTIDSIAPLFDKLELSNAAILLRGPERAVRDAYAAIGREPSVVD